MSTVAALPKTLSEAESVAQTCDNWDSEAAQSATSERLLTHPLDYSEEGLAMDATRRQHSPNPCACGCGEHPRNYYAKFIMGHRPKGDPVPRFWAKVNKDGPGGCWVWTGAKGSHGYGTFWTGERFIQAHRYSLQLAGIAATEAHIDHLCRVRACCNPDHLEFVTPSVNAQRALPYRTRATHCPQGHEYAVTGFVNGAGNRECRTCVQDRRRQHYERMKAGELPAPRAVLTHCRRGHEFTPENTLTDRHGRRKCAACARVSGRAGQARYKAKKRGEMA